MMESRRPPFGIKGVHASMLCLLLPPSILWALKKKFTLQEVLLWFSYMYKTLLGC